MARTPSFHMLALAALIALPRALATEAEQQPISPMLLDEHWSCEHPPHSRTYLVSKSPLVIYITDFLTPNERVHLQAISYEGFSKSRVLSSSSSSSSSNAKPGGVVHAVRTSQSTTVARDPVVECIEQRALSFQGFDTPPTHLEPLQLVKYGFGERYHFHTDWFTAPEHYTASQGGNRVSSFFAYVKAENVTGGGTNFPLLDAPRDERWCRWIDCDEEWEKGITFLPVEGNAVFWENLLPDGMGDQRTLHAGLPVTGGEKIGMNVWTRQAPLSEEIRGAVGGR